MNSSIAWLMELSGNIILNKIMRVRMGRGFGARQRPHALHSIKCIKIWRCEFFKKRRDARGLKKSGPPALSSHKVVGLPYKQPK
jgi:hypothetical protein